MKKIELVEPTLNGTKIQLYNAINSNRSPIPNEETVIQSEALYYNQGSG